MNDGNRQVWNGATLVTVAGISVCLFVAKYRSQIFYRFRKILDYKNPLRNQKIQVVNSVDECRLLMRNIKL